MSTADKDPMESMDASIVKLVSIAGKGFATFIFDTFKKAQMWDEFIKILKSTDSIIIGLKMWVIRSDHFRLFNDKL